MVVKLYTKGCFKNSHLFHLNVCPNWTYVCCNTCPQMHVHILNNVCMWVGAFFISHLCKCVYPHVLPFYGPSCKSQSCRRGSQCSQSHIIYRFHRVRSHPKSLTDHWLNNWPLHQLCDSGTVFVQYALLISIICVLSVKNTPVVPVHKIQLPSHISPVRFGVFAYVNCLSLLLSASDTKLVLRAAAPHEQKQD